MNPDFVDGLVFHAFLVIREEGVKEGFVGLVQVGFAGVASFDAERAEA